jgi:SAM-dependent methyltransferase
VYLNPRPAPDRVKDHYDDYLPDTAEGIAEWEASQRPVVRRAAKWLASRIPPGGRILDVGCGYGFLASALLARGFRAEGLEISPTGLKHTRSRGVEVRETTLHDAAFPAGSFDAVCAFYVIEHLEEPGDFFREAARVLRPGGVLLMRWPHTAPLVSWCRLLNLRVDLYDAPSHLVDFTPSSLKKLLLETGFPEVTTWPGGSTRPAWWVGRLAGFLGGLVGDGLYVLTGGRVLLPGPSKTTLAVRGG